MSSLLQMEPTLRLSAFVGVFAVMALLEAWFPRRDRRIGRRIRWPSNLGIVVLDTIVGRIVLPMAPVAFAVWVSGQGAGLLPWLGLQGVAAIVVGVVVFDLLIYLQHVMFHAVPMLWRVHRMHHADTDYDVTTGLRFHPVEIVLSLPIKLNAIAAFGPPPGAVLLFEVILNGMARFNHANVRLPLGLDRVLRLGLVTPDMHRVHHAVHACEMHTNFGFNLSVWDRLFGTYRDQPADGHEAMDIGLPVFRDLREAWLDRMLTLPFRADPAPSGLDVAGDGGAAKPE